MPIPKALTSRINSLKSGIGEAADKYFLGEGWKVVKEGIEAGWLPRWLILSGESLERYKEIFPLISSSVEIYVINSKEMEKLSTLETPRYNGDISKKRLCLSFRRYHCSY